MAQGNRGAGGLSTIIMIAAFVVIAGFLYWLSITAVPAEPVAAVEEDVPQAVSLTTFARNPVMYEGRLIQLDGVEVVAQLAPGTVLVSLPGGALYPIQTPPALAAGAQVGNVGSVTGRVEVLPEATIEAWAADSVFVDEAQQEAVAASGTQLVAEGLELMAPAPVADSAADGA